MNKIFLPAALLLSVAIPYAQTSDITKILNRELQKEVIAQKDDSLGNGERFEVVKQFTIKTGADRVSAGTALQVPDPNKIIVLEISKERYPGSFYIERQEVHLIDIRAIAKDGDILFEADPDSVTVTTMADGEEKSFTSNMFFLHLSHQKKNQRLAKEIVAAFKKIGIKLSIGFWAD